jgi:hypothetical protein
MASDRSRTTAAKPARRGLPLLGAWAYAVMAAGVAIQAVTGLGGRFLFGGNDGWFLFVHMIGAPIFIVGLTATTIIWAERCRFGPAAAQAGSGLTVSQRLMFWIGLVLGFVVISSRLAAMVPVFGYADQQALIEIHAVSAILLVIAMVVHTFVWLAAKRAKR